MTTKQNQRRFDAPAAAVYDALTAASQNAVDVVERDEQQRTLTWQTKKSLFSWGHIVGGRVSEDGDGAVLELVVSGLPDAPKALMDGKKNDSMCQRVLDEVAAQLG